MVKRFNQFIVFVKKTFRYRTVFFYNHLYHPSVCRNVFLKSGIIRAWPCRHQFNREKTIAISIIVAGSPARGRKIMVSDLWIDSGLSEDVFYG
jgi:hypothetical protein